MNAFVVTLALSLHLIMVSGKITDSDCPVVDVQDGFELDEFISKPWYIQQQMETQYLPKSQNYCVRAKYSELEPTNWRRVWGYTIQVHNTAQNADGVVQDSGTLLCAAKDPSSPEPAKLQVAPCFLPRFAAGPYWVVAYNSTEGFALISGGQPTIKTENGCTLGTGTNDSGLWIFTNAQKRDEELVQKARSIAADKGFDLTVLNDVDQTQCPPDSETAQVNAMGTSSWDTR